MNENFNEDFYKVWTSLNVRDEGMGCEFAEDIPIEQFRGICEHFYALALEDVKNKIMEIKNKMIMDCEKEYKSAKMRCEWQLANGLISENVRLICSATSKRVRMRG